MSQHSMHDRDHWPGLSLQIGQWFSSSGMRRMSGKAVLDAFAYSVCTAGHGKQMPFDAFH